jgi:subtilisin family serine protease
MDFHCATPIRAKGASAKRLAGLAGVRGYFLTWLLWTLFRASVEAVPVEPLAEYRSDQILILPAAGVAASRLAQFHVAQHTTVVARLEASGGLQVVAVPAGETVLGLTAQYQRSGLVEFAEPDYLRHLDLTTPDDPMFLNGNLWALDNFGQAGGTAHADIDATAAWDVLTSADTIIVAVLDTGIRYTHEDLAANMWINPIDGGHGTNSFAGTTDPNDDEGHGTIMAGVIGAVGNNGKGIVGVAWKVQLMACKCFNSQATSSDSAIIAAIDYARANGARIINASFDGTNLGLGLFSAISRAQAAGVLVVASSGNNFANVDVTPHYPACFALDNVVSVAYTTRNDALGQFSNHGATNVDLAAPGAGIYSCFFTSDAAYLGAPSLEGTSYGAAYVSGALALILAKYPGEPYPQAITRLLNGVDPVPGLAGKCATGGRLNLFKALVPPIHLSSVPSLVPNLLQFRLSSSPGRVCAVQSSTDLRHWAPLLTNVTSISGSFEFTDLALPNSGARFYRAIDSP